MKILLLGIGFFLISTLLVGQAFAIDFRDSTGYTPSWAKGSGYHSVLLECIGISDVYSRDGNWCMEWTAYVLDQGIENFPESTSGASTTSNVNNLSERMCVANKICAFPGEFLKYENADSYDDFSEIATVEFKEKINENYINVFIDGFGSKPLTYKLNLRTGIETHSQYTNVNRPFNLLEPIPMKIGQQVNQYMEGYYQSTIEVEKVVNFKEFGLMDEERSIMVAKTDLGNGDSLALAYDKQTGVLVSSVEKYNLDGKEYFSGLLLRNTNIFSAPTKITSIGTSSQINDPKIIEKQVSSSGTKAIVSVPQGTSNPGCEKTNRCFIPYEVKVDVGGGVTWSNDDSAAHTVTAGSAEEGPSQVFDSSLFMAGTTFSVKFEELGTFPYFCMVHPWMKGIVTVGEATNIPKKSETTSGSISVSPDKKKEFLDMNENDEPKTESTIVKEPPKSDITTAQKENSSEESEINAGNIALGMFVVLGIPAIIIGLIIWKIKRGRAKKQKMRETSWKGV